MARTVVNFVLLLALVGVLSLHVFAGRDLTQRNVEVMPEMVYSPAFDSYEPNPNFSDGKTLQIPEAGTIAHGRLPLHYTASFEDFIRAGEELHNPYSGDNTTARERGAFVYTNYCQMCHGPEGKGDGSVLQLAVQHGIPLPPASLVAAKPVPLKDGEMFHIITFGQRNMPAHAAQLTREDRWKVILHVRSLQQKAGGGKQP